MSLAIAEELAQFSAELAGTDIPDGVRDSARWHLLDTLGACVAGAMPGEFCGAALGELASRWRGGSASVVGTGTQTRPEAAALINGAFAQVLELDDKHGSSLARPGSSVVPAVLAAGEALDVSLDDALCAIVVGYEVMIRLGGVAGSGFLRRGFHTSALLGALGAAAAGGRVQRADAATIADALGIAGTFAAGIQESTRTGSTSKVLHGGWGAHAGCVAVELAECGFTGPASVLEGTYGLFHSHLAPDDEDLNFSAVTADLGVRWYTPETAFKPYPCCQILHSFIEACKEIGAALAADGAGVSEIEDVVCLVKEPGLTLVTKPWPEKQAPTHPHEARFSLPFVVASAMLNGDIGVDSFSESALRDREIITLAARVRAGEDPDSDYPLHCPARMEVKAAGRTYRSEVLYHPGSPEAALSPEAVRRKFIDNVDWLLGPTAATVADGIIAGEQKTVRELMAWFAVIPGAG